MRTMQLSDQLAGGPTGALTGRRHEIVALVAEGLANREIAERLGLATATVAVEILGLLSALELPNRLSLAAWFLRQPR
jgi:two-component system, NarL family, response regulator DevR